MGGHKARPLPTIRTRGPAPPHGGPGLLRFLLRQETLNVNGTTRLTMILLAFLSACATPEIQWSQEGKTETETQRDYKECVVFARNRQESDINASPFAKVDLEQCMLSRGYKPKP